MKLGFIGCGNMGKAMISGILEKELVSRSDIRATAASSETVNYINNVLKIHSAPDNASCAAFADVLVLAIKPAFMQEVIEEIKDSVKEDTIVISMAPGKNIDWFKEQFGKDVKVVRTAPNTPCMVGEGMTAICAQEDVSETDIRTVRDMSDSLGKTVVVPERLIDVASAVAGASPAFAFMYIEALADGAVAEGMPRAMAYSIAEQAVLGSAYLMQKSGKKPSELKDAVASPGGTTIEGINVLEQYSFRGAVIDAVRACVEKSKKM